MDRTGLVLFGKTRRAVLGYVLLEPRGFRLRELSRLAGISTGAIQHELAQLIDAGIIRREEEHGQILYRANTESQIYSELRAIIEKTIGGPSAIREALLPFGDAITSALIYGSTARGTADFKSDIDLLVVGDIPYTQLLTALQPVEAKLRREINPHLLSTAEYQEKIRKGDRFLSGVLNKTTLPIIGDEKSEPENLVKIGQLAEEPTDPEEIARFLGKLDERIKDAAGRGVGLDSTFDIAFEAVLQIALVALRANGLRSRTAQGHQMIAIQSLTLTLGISKEEMLVFDAFRRNRSKSLYSAEHEPTEAEVQGFIEATQDLQKKLLAWLKEKHPELLLASPKPKPAVKKANK